MDKFVRGYKVFNKDWTCSPGGNTKQYKSTIKAIPNLDGEIFEECTGIKIREVVE